MKKGGQKKLNDARRQPMEAQPEAEPRLHQALGAAGIGWWEWDLETGVIAWSCSSAEMRGLSSAVTTGKYDDFFGTVHTDDREFVTGKVISATKKPASFEIEFRVQHAGAKERWLSTKGHLLRDIGGKPGRIVGLDLDITERRRAEEELKQARAWLATTFEASRDGIVVERNEIIAYANASYARLYGYDGPDELIGKHISLVQGPHDNERMLEFSRRRLRGEATPEVYEFKGRCKDGSLIDLEASVSTSTIAGKTYITAVVRDIAQRKKAEAELRESEAKFRAVAETATCAIFIYQGPRFQYVNPATEEITGYSRAELASMNFWDVIHPDFRDLVRERGLARQRGEKVPSRYEVKIINKSGEERWLHITAGPFFLNGQPAALGTALDITDRKLAEEGMLENQARLSLLSSISTGMISGISVPEVIAHTLNRIHQYFEDICVVYATISSGAQWTPILVIDCLGISGLPTATVDLARELEHSAALRMRYPIILNDVARDAKAGLLSGIESIPGLGAMLAVPLPQPDNLTGLLCFCSPKARDWSGNEIGTLTEVADYLSIAISDAYAQQERKRAEEALARLLKQNELILNTAGEGIYGLDVEGRTTFVNPAAARMLGWECEELLRKSMHETLHHSHCDGAPYPREECPIHQAHVDGKIHHIDNEYFWRKDGTSFPVEYISTPIRDEHGGLAGAVVTFNDITERKQAEEALRDSEERYRLLFEGNPQPMWVYDLETLSFLAVNEAAVQHYGYSREEFLALTIQDIRPTEDKPALHNVLKTLSKRDGSGARKYRWKHQKKDGTVIDVEIASHELAFAGRPARLVLATDVTDRLRQEAQRKRAEEALRKSQQNYKALVNSLEGIVWESDAAFQFTFVSKQAERLLGYPIERWLTDPLFWKDHIHAEDRGWAMEYSRRATSEKRDHELEYRMIAADGRPVWFRDIVTVVIDDGRAAKRRGVMVDITTSKQAEEELNMLAQAIRSTSDCVSITDMEDNILFVNNAFLKTYGYEEAELLGKNIDVVRSPNNSSEVVEEILPATLRGGWQGELLNRRKSGGEFPIFLSTSIVRGEHGEPLALIGVARDIAERKLLEEQLRQAQKMEAVGRLAGGIAHDFNNLLTAILGYSDLVLSQITEEDPLHRDVEEIRRAGLRASSLTRQLLAYSRRQMLQPEVLELNSVVANMDKMLRRVIGENIKFVTLLQSALDPVKADPGQIEQVILNLVINARDAMPSGGKLIIETKNVELDRTYPMQRSFLPPGHYVMLAVTDTGVGMGPETKSQIFEPFFTTKEIGKGTGLGLSTVYGIVKQSGGDISVYSELGKGTAFKIYLPRVERAAQKQRGIAAVAKPGGGSETILLVEDEDAVRHLARDVLQQRGYSVLEATEGEEALRISETYQGAIQLILTDVVMPGMNGRELASRVASCHPGIKTLYMSGYTDESIVHHGILAPGADFLPKPFTPDILSRKVRQLLDK